MQRPTSQKEVEDPQRSSSSCLIPISVWTTLTKAQQAQLEDLNKDVQVVDDDARRARPRRDRSPSPSLRRQRSRSRSRSGSRHTDVGSPSTERTHHNQHNTSAGSPDAAPADGDSDASSASTAGVQVVPSGSERPSPDETAVAAWLRAAEADPDSLAKMIVEHEVRAGQCLPVPRWLSSIARHRPRFPRDVAIDPGGSDPHNVTSAG
jgi:hypothetical protein